MTEIKLKSDRFQGLAAGEHAPKKTFWQSVLPFLFKPPKGPSALPTMSFEEYANNQNRFRVLKKTNPEHADELMAASAKDVATRYDLYKKLAEMQADCGK